MLINILDNSKKLVGSLDTDYGEPVILNDKFTQYLDTGAYTLEFDAVFDARVDSEYANKLQERNYLVFQWHDKIKLFQIQTIKDTEGIDKITRNVYAVTCSLELYQTQIRPTTLEGTLSATATTVLQDTNFKVGRISPQAENLPGSLKITSITAAYTVLQNLVSAYGDVEIEIRVECIDITIGQFEFYVDFYYTGEVGNRTYNRIEYDWNEFGMTRETDTTDFYSGLIAQGANGITFADIYWDVYRGDPLNKPLGQDYLVDPELHAQYNNGGKYILGAYNSDATTSIDLLWETYYKLQEVKQKKLKFDVPLYITQEEYYNYDVGDTVHVVNPKFNPPVELEARIGTLVISFTDPNNCKATLSNYKEVKAQKKFFTPDDIIKDVVDTITGMHIGKLSEADKMAILQLLAKLNIRKEESDRILQEITKKLKEDIPQLPDGVTEDTEDYTQIKISNIDKGLWLGDKRIYDIKQARVANITNQPSGDISQDATNYKEAVAYYAGFGLGTGKDNVYLNKLSSVDNPYKLNIIVPYWANRFGIDPSIVYMLIYGESGGKPTSAGSSAGSGYGLLGCERSVFFNKTQTLTYADGTTEKFTPSYNTMKPYAGGNITINGVTVDRNISNQVKFGCAEFRNNAKTYRYNIFATIVSYNMGPGALAWMLNKYTCDTYGFTFNNKMTMYYNLPTNIKQKAIEVLDTCKGEFVSIPYRQAWQTYAKSHGIAQGTLRNLEMYLRWYKPVNNSLPYFIVNNKKVGYGVNAPANNTSTPVKGNTARDIIVATAKEIVSQHVDQKIATYDQAYRTWNFKRPNRRTGMYKGIKNPICYDCSSFVSCCYGEAGVTSVFHSDSTCSGGTLVKYATAKPGYKMWKVTTAGLNEAKPGDIVMDANFKITSSNLTVANMTLWNKTHHTMIYIGDGLIANAAQWAYWPNAIKTSSINYYINKGTAFFLRPYDLAALDLVVDSDSSTGKEGEIIVDDKIVQDTDLNCVTLKGVPGARAIDYASRSQLITNVTIGPITDNIEYPDSCEYIFVHFGIPFVSTDNAQEVINLVELLKYKYPKTPIFIAKEWHATSTLDNYSSINNGVDTYNTILEDYCNKTQYVIFLDIGDLPGTVDGYTCKDKETTQIYFNNVKTAIMNKVLGYNQKPSEDTSKIYNNVEYVLQAYDRKDFGVVSSIYVKCLTYVDEKFWGKFTFKTKNNSEPTKFTQSTITYLEGDDCKLGALVTQADTTYTITVMANPDRSQYDGKKYYGVVTANRGTGSYTDCGDFIGRDKIVELADDYYKGNAIFTYGNNTPLKYSNPHNNRSKWKNSSGKFYINGATFISLICRGISLAESPYKIDWRTNTKKSSTLSWSFNPGIESGNIAKYCVINGYANTSPDLTNYSNFEKGDLIFWDRDDTNLKTYMSISHVAICGGKDSDGDIITYGVSLAGNAVYKKKLKDNIPEKIVMTARIRKDG